MLVLKLVFQVNSLLLKLLNLLPQVEFKHACVLDLHLLCLQLSHLVEQLVLFGCVLGLCFADSRHQSIVLLSQLDLILLLHPHLVLQRADPGNKRLSFVVEGSAAILLLQPDFIAGLLEAFEELNFAGHVGELHLCLDILVTKLQIVLLGLLQLELCLIQL